MNKTVLSTIADTQQGQSPESIYYSDSEGIPFLQGNRTFGLLYPSYDTYTKKETKIAKKGDVLMSVRAPVGDLNIADRDICIGRGLASLRAKDGNNQFLYYALKYNVRNLVKQGAATTYDSVNRYTIRNFELIIPELTSDRKTVGEVLSALDAKIELNNKIITELEEMARTLYDYWFVQFDFPDANGEPYKTSGGKMAWSEELKREVPEVWGVNNILEVAEWIGGSQPPKSTFKFSPDSCYVRFIQNRDYANDENLTYIRINNSNKLCDELDIMMDKYGEAGKTRFGLAGAYNVALSRIKINLEYGQEYIRKFLESKQIHNYLYNACMASTRASLNEDIVGNLFLAIPKEETLKMFERHQKMFLYKILQNRKESEKLATLRDWLLPLLMNGQVTIKNHIT